MIKSDIGKNIKKRRQACNLSQRELGEKLGVRPQTISSWEVNRTEPSINDIEKMARIFGCTKSEILGNYLDDMAIDEYLTDPDLRRLILFAGGNIPAGDRGKMVDAIIFTIQAMAKKDAQ